MKVKEHKWFDKPKKQEKEDYFDLTKKVLGVTAATAVTFTGVKLLGDLT